MAGITRDKVNAIKEAPKNDTSTLLGTLLLGCLSGGRHLQELNVCFLTRFDPLLSGNPGVQSS